MKLVINEGREDDNLPEPESLSFQSADEVEFYYQLWALWSATDKRYLPSQLIPEIMSGHGEILTNILELESIYQRVKSQMKKHKKIDNAN